MAKFVFGSVENIAGKGENAGYQHFLLFPQCFQKGYFLRVVKNRDCVVKREMRNYGYKSILKVFKDKKANIKLL